MQAHIGDAPLGIELDRRRLRSDASPLTLLLCNRITSPLQSRRMQPKGPHPHKSQSAFQRNARSAVRGQKQVVLYACTITSPASKIPAMG